MFREEAVHSVLLPSPSEDTAESFARFIAVYHYHRSPWFRSSVSAQAASVSDRCNSLTSPTCSLATLPLDMSYLHRNLSRATVHKHFLDWYEYCLDEL
jgi:hypothetical protein